MTDLLEGVTVSSIEDMVSGAGMGIKSSAVSVERVKVGLDINANENTAMSFVEAEIAVEIDFNAGYSLGGKYTYTSKSDIESMSTHEKRMKCVEQGLFELDIAYSKDDDMPFDNWWVRVADDEGLLGSITTVGSDYCDDEDAECGALNEPFSYDYFDANQQVAYQMLHDLMLNNHSKRVEPYTQDFVTELHVKIKAGILAQLSLHH